MSFVTAYRAIKPCVAAVIQTFYPGRPPDFPTILGTGFLASRLGLLCTCRHVADAVRSLPRPVGFQGEPASALFFMDFAHEGERGVGVLSIPIQQIGDATLIGDAGEYLGPNPPGVSSCLLAVTDTPTVTLAVEGLSGDWRRKKPANEFLGTAWLRLASRVRRPCEPPEAGEA